MKFFGALSIALGVLSVSHGPVFADTPVPLGIPQPENGSSEPRQWHFSASPYFWAAGIDGTVGQFEQPPTEMNSDFDSILKELDFSFMSVAEGRYDRYSLFGDVMYTKISTGGATPIGEVDVTSETFSGFFGGGYSVLEDGESRLDIVAGGRVWYAGTEISIGGTNLRDSATWVDAVGGIRGQYFFTDNFYLTGWGVVGAGQAKIDWDVAAALGYQFRDKWSAVAGYRALGVDYSRDGFVFDVVQQGPILGLVYHF